LLTTRGRWFLIVAGLMLFWSIVAIGDFVPFVLMLGITAMLWFCGEWMLFALRTRYASNQITLERTLIQNERPQPNLWANVRATVRLTVTMQPDGWRLPFVQLADNVPVGLHILSGTRRIETVLQRGESIDIEYDVTPTAPGVALFEGLEVRAADLTGFFYKRWFLRVPMESLVLPMLVGEEGNQRATKRINTLPPPGMHRLRRPGGGSELLDLREYRPGDPPKTIAWKASARRDMLITKEFENDVPVRCTLFLDTSNAMRLGEPGDTPLAYASGLSATLAQAIASNRDIVGVCLFDEENTQRMKPARTRIHTMQMLRTFAEAAALQPEFTLTDQPMLQRLSLSLANELYPELLAKPVNSRPFGLFWIPLLDSRAKWLLLIPMAFVYSLFTNEGLNTFISIINEIVRPNSPEDFVPFVVIGLIVLAMPLALTGVFWLIFGLRGFFPPRSRLLRERKTLAALFCGIDGDNPSALERYIHDDEFFNARANRFLADHRSLPPPAMLDDDGNYRFLGASKAEVLCDAMLRSIGTAKDNELYVILADLVELNAEQLEPVLKAVRAARGRHHQVMILLPWPVDLPDKPEEEKPDRDLTIKRLIEDNLYNSYRGKFDRTRNALIRCGASVLKFYKGDAVRLILQRIEQVRHARIRR
jgi:uncharacterized protein (DUF58 family)